MTLNLPVHQPVSETTTSESSVSLPSPHLAAHAQRAPVPVAPIVILRLRHHPRSSSQPSSNASSPETSSSASTSRSTSPELLEMERSFNSLLAGTRDRQSHPVTRSQMDNLRDQTARIAVLKQVPVSRRTNHRPSQRLQLQICHFPRIPEDVQVTRGLRARCRQRMPMLLVRAVTQRQTDYRHSGRAS